MTSYLFAPSVGGIETVSATLAHDFARRGAEVKLLTTTPAVESGRELFEVVRRPTPRKLLQLVRWSDVIFHNNISLTFAWPQLLIRRPWVIAFHTWLTRSDGRTGWQDRLKCAMSRRARCISVSNAIAEHLPVFSKVVGNPYDESEFRELPGLTRSRDLVFLGRLVSDKGVDILLRALDELKQRGVSATLTIVGKGPEEPTLRELARTLNLSEQIDFAGEKTGAKLVRLLNTHKMIVIPSRWREPFGIVALEGIACGCVAIGSEGGGLPDAIGPCGMTFPNGDISRLVQILFSLLTRPDTLAECRRNAENHLAQFKRAVIAQKYYEILSEAVESYGYRRVS
jgi:glycosyltransferase involved in cell wall biosynthesis